MNIIISGCEEDTKIYKKIIGTDANLSISGTATTNEETIQQFIDKNPDLLIIDTSALNINSLYILSKLMAYDNKMGQRIMLIIDPALLSVIDESTFSGIIEKPVTPEKILDSIYKIKPVNQPVITKQDIKKLLLTLKIDLYSNGIHFIIEAILLAAENHKLLQNLQEIYERIGNLHNVPYDKIKWSIRSSIDTINKYADTDTFKSVLKYYDETRPLTPKYFIKLVLYYFDIDSDE